MVNWQESKTTFKDGNLKVTLNMPVDIINMVEQIFDVYYSIEFESEPYGDKSVINLKREVKAKNEYYAKQYVVNNWKHHLWECLHKVIV